MEAICFETTVSRSIRVAFDTFVLIRVKSNVVFFFFFFASRRAISDVIQSEDGDGETIDGVDNLNDHHDQ